MLSFNSLGKHGRLGNQMFQYASLKGIATNRGFQFSIPYSTGVDEWNDHRLFSIFNMYGTHVGQHSSNPMVTERGYHFDQDLFDNCPDNVDLVGYFQSYKYFDHIRDEILSDFTFKDKDLPSSKDHVVIHVRRGDYVNQPDFHPVCDLEYYKKAMEHFDGEKFIVISDDYEWCLQQEVFKNCKIPTETSQERDLHLMANAKGNIIANSSFSWWGAYLNQNNPTVVCPQQWFGRNYSNYDMSDLRPESWIQL